MDHEVEQARTRPGPQSCAALPRPGIGQRAALLVPICVGLAGLAGCVGASAEEGGPGAASLGEARLAGTKTSAAIGPWVMAAPMSVARGHHTATRLLDGRVLIAGGQPLHSGVISDEAHASAALYDPATGAWTAAASMGSARSQHAATLLSNGDVFVHGAASYLPSATTAEIYRPALDVWTAVAPAPIPRVDFEATLLPDGNVLVTGGYSRHPVQPAEALSSCAIYDPALDVWSAASPMSDIRGHHVATPLQDGKVLAIGAFSAAAAEIYDPATDAWTPGAPLLANHAEYTATLLPGGEVLVTDIPRAPPQADAEVYSPATGAWTAAPSRGWTFDGSVSGQATTPLPDGRALVSGGVELVAPACGTVTCWEMSPPAYASFFWSTDVYDPATNTWSLGPEINVPRSEHSATLLLDGTVLVAGGYASLHEDGYHATRSVERLTIAVVPGAPCGSSLDCGGRSCVDGVCCDTACDGACEACSVAAGAAQDGVCSPLTGPACDDGDACTGADACQAGRCAGAPVGDGAPCDDGDACTQADACAAGACVGAAPVVCAAADPCQTPVCDPSTGRCLRALSPAGASCSDGDACTQGDVCQAGACIPGTPIACEASAPCRASACDAATGTCVESVLPDGASCEDGDPCTLSDACQAGACTPGAPKVCPVRSSCYEPGVCDPSAAGDCSSWIVRSEGAPCPDPTSSVWVPAAPAVDLRPWHTATLLPDGTVLIAGGEMPSSGSGPIPLSSAMRYDPATDTWAPTSAMHHARFRHTATLLPDGTVLVAGGYPATARAERYDPTTGAWTEAAPMNVARGGPAAALLSNGAVLVVGGVDGSYRVSSAELYDPVANTWAFVSSMHRARGASSATPLMDGRVLVVGGADASPEVYDPSTDTWTMRHLSWDEGNGHTATRLPDGRVLVVHGVTNPWLSRVHLFDPSSATWRTGPHANCEFSGAELLADGKVLVTRCWADPPRADHSAAQLYDPASDAWSLAPSPPQAFGATMAAVRLADGRVLLTGCVSAPQGCSALLYVPGDTAPGEGACARGVCMPAEGSAGGEGGSGGDVSASAGGAGGIMSSGEGGAGGSPSGEGDEASGAGGTSSGGGGGAAASAGGDTSSAGDAGGAASGAGGAGSSSSAGGAGSSSSAGGGTGGGPSGAGGGGVGASAQGSSGASTPDSDGGGGGCSTARLPGGASGAPWLLLLSLLGARRQASRRRAPRARLDG
ncbi:kelch repeat-containing protein [Sorangium sp. So ce542]|uniref:Kelch repeat-containing protein n=1 Tax=Sorangium sp. So ce542 TaxID=3133316 RepID=UPI003F62A866